MSAWGHRKRQGRASGVEGRGERARRRGRKRGAKRKTEGRQQSRSKKKEGLSLKPGVPLRRRRRRCRSAPPRFRRFLLLLLRPRRRRRTPRSPSPSRTTLQRACCGGRCSTLVFGIVFFFKEKETTVRFSFLLFFYLSLVSFRLRSPFPPPPLTLRALLAGHLIVDDVLGPLDCLLRFVFFECLDKKEKEEREVEVFVHERPTSERGESRNRQT